ncbi:MAG: 4a-hydroxytetrahydrobiopterin dehydratase [Nanoarchaeota archaeon]
MSFRVLDKETILDELRSLPDWKFVHNSLRREYKFSSFEKAIAFMVECRPKISKENHHPNWRNLFDKVFVEYTTHDAGDVVTDRDFTMATTLECTYQVGYRI